jgi:hypothetical protein
MSQLVSLSRVISSTRLSTSASENTVQNKRALFSMVFGFQMEQGTATSHLTWPNVQFGRSLGVGLNIYFSIYPSIYPSANSTGVIGVSYPQGRQHAPPNA